MNLLDLTQNKIRFPAVGATKVFVRIFWVLVTDRAEILREASKPL